MGSRQLKRSYKHGDLSNSEKEAIITNRDKDEDKSALNNVFSTSPFAVERVRQGDRLSAYLFIIALEVLCVNIRNSRMASVVLQLIMKR